MTKITTALAAVAILGCGVAFAVDQPPAPTATPVKKATSLKACNKKADDKKLTGAERSQFVKSCRTGKSKSAGQ